jgi:hypothetical protein
MEKTLESARKRERNKEIIKMIKEATGYNSQIAVDKDSVTITFPYADVTFDLLESLSKCFKTNDINVNSSIEYGYYDSVNVAHEIEVNNIPKEVLP